MNRLDWELYCATELLNRRRLSGQQISAELITYYEELKADWEMMSGNGPETGGIGDTSPTMGVEEVAAMLNITARHVRRIAPRLGAERVNTSWIFQRATVEEYARRRESA